MVLKFENVVNWPQGAKCNEGRATVTAAVPHPRQHGPRSTRAGPHPAPPPGLSRPTAGTATTFEPRHGRPPGPSTRRDLHPPTPPRRQVRSVRRPPDRRRVRGSPLRRGTGGSSPSSSHTLQTGEAGRMSVQTPCQSLFLRGVRTPGWMNPKSGCLRRPGIHACDTLPPIHVSNRVGPTRGMPSGFRPRSSSAAPK